MGVQGSMYAFVLPHHLITAPYLTRIYREMWDTHEPSRIILISPNHYENGEEWTQTCLCTFQAPDGTLVETDTDFIHALADRGVVTIRPEPFVKEHGIYNHMPFIARFFPGTKVVPIILKWKTPEELRVRLADALNTLSDKDTVLIASVDFSHYISHTAADFHDATSWATLHNFDFFHVGSLEVDSQPSLEVTMRWSQARGLRDATLLKHTNSQDFFLQSLLDVTTSHLMVGFGEGQTTLEPETSMHFFGDTLAGRGTEPAFLSGTMLKELQGDEERFFWGAHANILNLEGPIASEGPQQNKEVVLMQNPRIVDFLQHYDFRYINIANNHALDLFLAGELATKKLLRAGGLIALGGYEAGTSTDCVPVAGSAMMVPLCSFNDVGQVLNVPLALEEVRAHPGAVVQMHWGEEYATQPTERQRTLAKQFIQAGARLIVGHHPHVIEDTEIIDGVPVIYSLGNFIFDQNAPEGTQTGLSLGVTVTPQQTFLYLLPFWTNLGAPRQMTEQERRDWLGQHTQNLQQNTTAIPGKFTFKAP